jgi:DNA mismatch endonuclease (patch repair protein)
MSRWPQNHANDETSFGHLSRSQLMSRVRGTGNKSTELAMMRLLRTAKLSGWRRHLSLPGKPDFAWRSSKIAVFVDGCFWHGHGCGRNLSPRTNAAAWTEKIRRNVERDRRKSAELRRTGWAVVRIWECDLTRDPQRALRAIKRAVSRPPRRLS